MKEDETGAFVTYLRQLLVREYFCGVIIVDDEGNCLSFFKVHSTCYMFDPRSQ